MVYSVRSSDVVNTTTVCRYPVSVATSKARCGYNPGKLESSDIVSCDLLGKGVEDQRAITNNGKCKC